MYNPKPGTKVYRLTRRTAGGYTVNKYFPATAAGLGDALRAWRRGRNRGTGQQHGGIKLVEAQSK